MKIYSVKVSRISTPQLQKLLSLIEENRKNRIMKFTNKKDLIRSLIGEVLIRTLILKLLCIENKLIKFNINKYGKPYLENFPNFHFNISHSGDYVVCAIDNMNIGIDIEKIVNINYKAISMSFFTQQEYQYIINKDLSEQLSTFYALWTLKESYIKFLGTGLSKKMNSFFINIKENQNIKVCADSIYTLKTFNVIPNYKISVCSSNNSISENVYAVKQKNLIRDFLNCH